MNSILKLLFGNTIFSTHTVKNIRIYCMIFMVQNIISTYIRIVILISVFISLKTRRLGFLF